MSVLGEMIASAGQHALLELMTQANVPITRRSYVDANWGGDPPRPWDYLAEEEMPAPLQDVRSVHLDDPYLDGGHDPRPWGAEDAGPPDEPRDYAGKWTSGAAYNEWAMPPAPGTAPIPEGAVRLYHQTAPENAKKIGREGILLAAAQGIEGPRAIYADEHGFYGEPSKFPQGLASVEFWVPREQWDRPLVNVQKVDPSQIVGVHLPWQGHARYAEEDEGSKQSVLNGDLDWALENPKDEYGDAVRYIKAKYGAPPAEDMRAMAVPRIPASVVALAASKPVPQPRLTPTPVAAPKVGKDEFNPEEPRKGSGQPGGGEWTSSGAGVAGAPPEGAVGAPRAAGTLMVDKHGRGLFIRRTEAGDHKGTWALPGGGIEAGEDPEAAAGREAGEEIGHVPPGERKLIRHSTGWGRNYVTYRQEVGEPFEPTLNSEHDAYQWADLDNPPQPLHPGVASLLSETGGKAHEGAEGEEFFSPSVTPGTLEDAEASLNGPRTAAMLKASREIDEGLGIKSHDIAAIGAWSDGAESSIVTVASNASMAQLRAAAAMKGLLAHQKAVLVCREDPGAHGLLYHFVAKGRVPEIHAALLKAGLPFHTLAPMTLSSGEGAAAVYVADPEGTSQTFEAVQKAAGQYNAEVTYHHCEAEFIGAGDESAHLDDNGQRDAARESYYRAIGESGVPGSDVLWARVHSAYGTSLAQAATGLKGEGADAALKLKQQWAAQSSIKTVDHLMQASPANQKLLGDAGREIAEKLGAAVSFVDPGVKKRERVEEKIAARPGRTAGSISDAVRAGFMVRIPGQADVIVRELAKRFEIADEGWAMTPAGYFDRKVLVRFPDGQLGETQLWAPSMLRAKEHGGGHELYERERALPKGSRELADTLAQERMIYDVAAASAGPAWRALLGSLPRAGVGPSIS